MDVLRKSTELVSGSSGATARAVDDAALTSAHGRAQTLLRDAVKTTEHLVGATSHHRGSLDALGERQRAIASRILDMRSAATRLADTESRLGVVALNAGLEGARIEGLAGRALVMLADEVRSLLSRATSATSELSTGLEEMHVDVTKLDAQLGDVRTSGGQLTEEASRSLNAAHDADGALSELGDQLRRATGVDPELAAAVESAQTHARDLVAALTLVSSRAQGTLAAAALRPIIEPIGRLLDQLDVGEPEDTG
jgi:methyl-accepting chemotaxis protein